MAKKNTNAEMLLAISALTQAVASLREQIASMSVTPVVPAAAASTAHQPRMTIRAQMRRFFQTNGNKSTHKWDVAEALYPGDMVKRGTVQQYLSIYPEFQTNGLGYWNLHPTQYTSDGKIKS